MTYQIQSSFAENFKIITDTTISKQSLTTTDSLATGSEIDYLPAPNASYVVYHYSVHLFADTGASGEKNATFTLQYSDDNGASWSNWGGNTEVFVHSAGTYLKMRSVVDVKFCVSTTGWTSLRRLRLVVNEDSGSDTALHQFDQVFIDETTNHADQKYYPSVSCYSVE